MPLRRIWTKLGEVLEKKLPGDSYTAQGPQKQPEILKHLTFTVRETYENPCLGDLDFGFQTFGAGSREEISLRI